MTVPSLRTEVPLPGTWSTSTTSLVAPPDVQADTNWTPWYGVTAGAAAARASNRRASSCTTGCGTEPAGPRPDARDAFWWLSCGPSRARTVSGPTTARTTTTAPTAPATGTRRLTVAREPGRRGPRRSTPGRARGHRP